MYLFILESLGTSELLLIGIVALMFLGPRKLPGLARKAGKLMAEFRGTASEFKETWQREVNFEEEAKLLNLNSLEADEDKPVDDETVPIGTPVAPVNKPAAPAIKELDPADFPMPVDTDTSDPTAVTPDAAAPNEDKKNWL